MISVDQLIRILENRFDQHRYRHSLGVADEAKRLAIKEGLDGKKAYLAGLLHDYARVLTEVELQKLAVLSNWKIDNDEKSIPILLHAPVGADLVQKELKIDDQEILEAIRYHTIGSPEMGQLARIIYIADYIEPGRDFPGLDLIRKEVEEGILPALITITSNLIKYNIDQGRIIHPNTLLLRNTCLRRMK